MSKDCENFLGHLNRNNPPKDLLDRIFFRINKEQRKRVLRARIVSFGSISIIAAVVLVFSLGELQKEIAQSGFTNFISILFSDWGIVSIYWKEFAISLLESMPIFGIAAVLGSILLFLASLKIFTRDIRTISAQPSIIKAV